MSVIFKVYGYLVLRNRVTSDPVKVLVDRWPEFRIMICQPLYVQVTKHLTWNVSLIFCVLTIVFPLFSQRGDLFKDTVVFATDEVILKETFRKSTVFNWTKFLCLGNSITLFYFSLYIDNSVLNPHIVFCEHTAITETPRKYLTKANNLMTKGSSCQMKY